MSMAMRISSSTIKIRSLRAVVAGALSSPSGRFELSDLEASIQSGGGAHVGMQDGVIWRMGRKAQRRELQLRVNVWRRLGQCSKRDIQLVDESGRFEREPPLRIGTGKRAFQKHSAKSLMRGRFDCGTMTLLPAKEEAGIRALTSDDPADRDLTAIFGQCAVLDSIGGQLVQQQGKVLDLPTSDLHIRAIEDDAVRIGRKLGGDDLLDGDVFQVRAQQQVLRARE